MSRLAETRCSEPVGHRPAGSSVCPWCKVRFCWWCEGAESSEVCDHSECVSAQWGAMPPENAVAHCLLVERLCDVCWCLAFADDVTIEELCEGAAP